MVIKIRLFPIKGTCLIFICRGAYCASANLQIEIERMQSHRLIYIHLRDTSQYPVSIHQGTITKASAEGIEWLPSQ